eukprot:TRINITY_DN70765_c0_g1_i1.p1 TRINITY_DN70765_c0_g1~~TRINITY_DN70765_c0_g1_i1.p1  ORF type:complete len:298 (+),score=22.18 TRINITY_DN70765_c0_g1_i1:1-894(+)
MSFRSVSGYGVYSWNCKTNAAILLCLSISLQDSYAGVCSNPVDMSVSTDGFQAKDIDACEGGASYDSVVFCHAPHTGGTTLRHMLKALCRLRNLTCLETAHRLPPTEEVPEGGLDILMGHFPYVADSVTRLMRGHPLVVTIVRDPLDVTVSNYIHRETARSFSFHAMTMGDTGSAALFGRIRYPMRALVPSLLQCSGLQDKLSQFDIIAPYEVYHQFVYRLAERLPAKWHVHPVQLCPTVRKNRLQKKSKVNWVQDLKSSLSGIPRAVWYFRFRCHEQAYRLVRAAWQNQTGCPELS